MGFKGFLKVGGTFVPNNGYETMVGPRLITNVYSTKEIMQFYTTYNDDFS